MDKIAAGHYQYAADKALRALSERRVVEASEQRRSEVRPQGRSAVGSKRREGQQERERREREGERAPCVKEAEPAMAEEVC